MVLMKTLPFFCEKIHICHEMAYVVGFFAAEKNNYYERIHRCPARAGGAFCPH